MQFTDKKKKSMHSIQRAYISKNSHHNKNYIKKNHKFEKKKNGSQNSINSPIHNPHVSFT